LIFYRITGKKTIEHKKRPAPGGPRRGSLPLTVASFRTWRGWAAAARTVPDAGHLMLYAGRKLVKPQAEPA